MARHIVTGGSGFVGGRLVKALTASGEKVVIFDIAPPAAADRGVDVVLGDVTRPEDLDRLGLQSGDIVHHLAARQFHGDVPQDGQDAWFRAVNVAGTARILEAMSRAGAGRLVFFSTDMTYGRPKTTPVPATHAQSPIGPYGRSKREAELLLRKAGADFGLRATIFRPRLIAGAGRLGILAKLFALIEHNLPVPMIGSGRNRYQMIAVEDCASAAIQAAALGCPSDSFNLGSDDPPTVRELLADLIRRAESRAILLPTPAPAVQAVLALLDSVGLTLLHKEQYAIADIDYVLDTSHTREALSWSPSRRDQDIIFDAFSAARGLTAQR